MDKVSGVGNPAQFPKFKVPTPFKMGVGNKMTFYYKDGDFKAGLAGVSVEVQGIKAAQVRPELCCVPVPLGLCVRVGVRWGEAGA